MQNKFVDDISLPPFSARFTPEVPEILNKLQCTLALSTYQAGKVVFLSADKPQKLVQLSRSFEGAMGIAANKSKLAVACSSEVNVLKNIPEMAAHYPNKKNTYDALFFPRASFYTGHLSLHDMHWEDDNLYAVNTLFSCISEINTNYSFKPVWKPKFISKLMPEDRCHLNGLAVKSGKMKYATALGMTNTDNGWRENKLSGGVLIDIESNEIVLSNLSMPHSPRIYNDKLYLLQSAAGELIEADLDKQTYRTIKQTGYFVRGMELFGDYLFIGHSKLRHKTSAFRDLPIADKSQKAGVLIMHLPSESIVGRIVYENSVDEIYDVKVLPNMTRPNILNPNHEASGMGIHSPSGNFWAVKQN